MFNNNSLEYKQLKKYWKLLSKDASKLEFHIKKNLTKTQKEELIKDAKKLRYLKEKINIKDYKVLSKKEINNINAKENV